TFVYLVNNSPWKCQVTMKTNADHPCSVQELGGQRAVPEPGQGRWSVMLDQYDLLAVRFDQRKIELSDVAITFDKDVRGLLQQRIQELSDRTVELNRRTVIDVLENPDFELPPSQDHPIRGWSLVNQDNVEVELDQNERRRGRAAARLNSTRNVASLISNRFPAIKTGRISFTVWLKMSPDFQGPLRLAVGGRHQGQEIYRFGVVDKTHEWNVYVFYTDDLPLSELSDMQVRFDLMGPGEVWIDDIEVSDLRFSDNERKEMTRILTQAHFAAGSGKLSECHRILQGYWPRFLLKHISLPQRPIASLPPPLRQAKLPKPEPQKEDNPWWKKSLPEFFK
ncbi:MAG: hypothetical protein N2C12_17215, partial [Planctomycetales bacterium]